MSLYPCKAGWLCRYEALVLAFGLLVGSGLISSWGEWYSSWTSFRRQTEGLLNGRLALGTNLAEAEFDHTFSEGGVHQVWGLGVPLWRLPWEVLARLCGFEAFPDRIAFGLFAGLVAFVVMRCWVREGGGAVSINESEAGEGGKLGSGPESAPPPCSESEVTAAGRACSMNAPETGGRGGEKRSLWFLVSAFLGSFLLLLLLPPSLLLLQTRGAVWEEPVAYEYFYGVMLVSLLAAFARQPTLSRWLWLAALAGLGGLIRPTLAFYGLATMVVGSVVWVMTRYRRNTPAEEESPSKTQPERPLAVRSWIAAVFRRFGWSKGTTVQGAHPEKRQSAGALQNADASREEPCAIDDPLASADRLKAGLRTTGVLVATANRLKAGLQTRGGALALIAMGVALFCAGGFLLYYTNLKRFGDGFEFGHRLNVQTLYGSLYATKFDDPFQDEPLPSAARELFGALFLVNRYSGSDWYRTGFFPGQSPTVRWREFYFRTYDLTYVPILLLGWGAGLCVLWRAWRGTWARKVAAGRSRILQVAVRASGLQPADAKHGEDSASPLRRAWDLELITLASWSLLATIPLAAFYVRVPVISSRYLLDFGPAFAAAALATWLFVFPRCQRSWTRWLASIVLCGWVGVELSLGESVYGPPRSVRWSEVKAQMERLRKPRGPVVARTEQTIESRSNLNAFDGAGWNSGSGAVTPLITVFMHSPEFLELELETQPHPEIQPNPEDIRAKVQLEHLKRESLTKTERGWLVRFAGPTRKSYQTGFQTVFIATVPKQYLAEPATPWILKRVTWGRAEDR